MGQVLQSLSELWASGQGIDNLLSFLIQITQTIREEKLKDHFALHPDLSLNIISSIEVEVMAEVWHL